MKGKSFFCQCKIKIEECEGAVAIHLFDDHDFSKQRSIHDAKQIMRKLELETRDMARRRSLLES